MSFYAYKEIQHISKVEASAIITPEERSAAYYCPGCSCIFHFRSKSSNGKAAHFYRYSPAHDENCWMPTGKSQSGDIQEYDWDNFSAEALLNALETSKDRNSQGIGTAGGGSPGVAKIKPSTLRQLFQICCENSEFTTLPNGLIIRDIICSRKTAYYYTSYCKNIKLIEAKFVRCINRINTLEFSYPYEIGEVKHQSFSVKVKIKNNELYAILAKTVRKTTSPILLYAKWISFDDGVVFSQITNKHQVVPLK